MRYDDLSNYKVPYPHFVINPIVTSNNIFLIVSYVCVVYNTPSPKQKNRILKEHIMNDLHLAKTCELHVHPGGCLTAQDLLELGRNIYQSVDWTLFTDAYEKAYGMRPDPITLYQNALSDPSTGFDTFKKHFIYTQEDGGDFGRFQAKFNFLICLLRHPAPHQDMIFPNDR
jgi:hypothetical protein